MPAKSGVGSELWESASRGLTFINRRVPFARFLRLRGGLVPCCVSSFERAGFVCERYPEKMVPSYSEAPQECRFMQSCLMVKVPADLQCFGLFELRAAMETCLVHQNPARPLPMPNGITFRFCFRIVQTK